MPHPASGGAKFLAETAKRIRFVRMGCTNRPFYHIVVMELKKDQHDHCIEQLGSYDPLPNKYNEKLASLNYERIGFWIGAGATIATPVQTLLGLAGFLPIHPKSAMDAWRNRQAARLPEPPLPSKLTWRERKKILLQKAAENPSYTNDEKTE